MLYTNYHYFYHDMMNWWYVINCILGWSVMFIQDYVHPWTWKAMDMERDTLFQPWNTDVICACTRKNLSKYSLAAVTCGFLMFWVVIFELLFFPNCPYMACPLLCPSPFMSTGVNLACMTAQSYYKFDCSCITTCWYNYYKHVFRDLLKKFHFEIWLSLKKPP